MLRFSAIYRLNGSLAPVTLGLTSQREMDALVAAAATLPRIAIEAPATSSVIGRTTESQMLIGVYWGYVSMMEGLIGRMKSEIGQPLTVIATGGLAILFDRHTDIFDAVDADLTLEGMAILAEKAK